MINIFTQATGVYNEYIPTLQKSLVNVFPNEKKQFIVISDKKPSHCDIYHHICDLSYSLNLYNRVEYIYDCIKENNINDEDYFIFVDADSVFRKKNDEFWDYMKTLFDTQKILFAKSPWRDTAANYENEQNKDWCPEVYIENIQTNKYIQSSFFAGIIKSYNQFHHIYSDLAKKININHRKHLVIPFMHDQSCINKIVSDSYDSYIVDDFIYNWYSADFVNNERYLTEDFTDLNITTGSSYSFNAYPNIFVIQKFNEEIKHPKRIDQNS